jgi:hypothetical protein
MPKPTPARSTIASRISRRSSQVSSRSISSALTVGYQVFVCENLAFCGDLTPVVRKHSKHFDPVEVIDLWSTRRPRRLSVV